MSFPFFIARRYLFSKKSHNAINIISAISVGGVALATMALVCTLSVFNGFRDLIGSLYTAVDPQLKVVPVRGKFAEQADTLLQAAARHPDVAVASASLEDNALILFRGHPTVVTLKGVDDSYADCTGIRSILYGNGSWQLHAAGVDYGIPGIGLAQQIGSLDYGSLQICAPRKGERINTVNPAESFNVAEVNSCGVCFDVHQRKYDETLLLAPLSLAQQLFEQEGKITSLELRLRKGTDTESVKRDLRRSLGEGYSVLDRMEQQQEMFNIMSIEKSMAYLFLTFILLVACFNIIGSVSMLIIDKRGDVDTLRHLGAPDRTIVRIFLYEGRLISLLGAVIGIAAGLFLCYLQETFGLLRLGGSSGNFIIDAYPVSVRPADILLVFLTVLAVGFVSVYYPVKYLSKRFL